RGASESGAAKVAFQSSSEEAGHHAVQVAGAVIATDLNVVAIGSQTRVRHRAVVDAVEFDDQRRLAALAPLAGWARNRLHLRAPAGDDARRQVLHRVDAGFLLLSGELHFAGTTRPSPS